MVANGIFGVLSNCIVQQNNARYNVIVASISILWTNLIILAPTEGACTLPTQL